MRSSLRVAFWLLAGVAPLLAAACDSGGSISELVPARATATPEPAATATPAPQPPLSAGPSRWGWKGTRGRFAFLTVAVHPGADPAADPWNFDLGRQTIECLPEGDAARRVLDRCRGTQPGNLFRAVVEDDQSLEVEMLVEGETFKERLTRVETKAEPLSTPNVRLAWHFDSGRGSTGIWAEGGVVFAPHFDGTIDLLDAASGQRLAVADTAAAQGRPGAVSEVTARGGWLYASTSTRGLVVFDVRDPRNPVLAGQYIVETGGRTPETFTNVHTLFLAPDGRTLFAVNQSHPATDLRAFDVSDPARPREVGRYSRPGVADVLDGFHEAHVTEYRGHTVVFLHSLRSGLFILDATDPAAMRELSRIAWPDTLSHSGGAFQAGGRLYYAHNDEGFDQGMTVLDVTDLAAPKVVSRYQTRRGVSIHNLHVVAGIAYVAYYTEGLRIVDLRDPAHPREVAHYDTVPPEAERGLFQGAWGVRVMDGRVFLSDTDSGTWAFEVDVR